MVGLFLTWALAIAPAWRARGMRRHNSTASTPSCSRCKRLAGEVRELRGAP